MQNPDAHNVAAAELKVVTKKQPTPQQLQDLMFAWRVAKFVKSNAIVFCGNGMTLGVGAGQMSRVDSAPASPRSRRRTPGCRWPARRWRRTPSSRSATASMSWSRRAPPASSSRAARARRGSDRRRRRARRRDGVYRRAAFPALEFNRYTATLSLPDVYLYAPGQVRFLFRSDFF